MSKFFLVINDFTIKMLKSKSFLCSIIKLSLKSLLSWTKKTKTVKRAPDNVGFYKQNSEMIFPISQ